MSTERAVSLDDMLQQNIQRVVIHTNHDNSLLRGSRLCIADIRFSSSHPYVFPLTSAVTTLLKSDI